MLSGTHLRRCCQIINLLVAAAAATASSAHAALTISGGATKNVSCASGVCTANAKTAVLNKTDLETMLAASNVQIVPGSTAMNIVINAGVTWASAYALTLDSYQSITINQAVSINGTGGLAILTNDGGGGGDYAFGPKGKVTFLSTSDSLTINGAAFTLLGSMADVQNINNNLTGNYALANSYSASGITNWAPLGSTGRGFTGSFEGLGNTISNLTVNVGSSDDAGFFATNFGTIRDVGVVGGAVIGGQVVGGLVALGGGTIAHCYSTGNVGGNTSSIVGGLVGEQAGLEGTISDSYATGAVTGRSEVGGLVGELIENATISQSFATGAVTAISKNGPGTGGLVGYQHDGQSVIQNSFATGALPGTTNYRGGLIGQQKGDNVAIVNSYSTGMINNGGSEVGGFAGESYSGTGDDYWDITTSGMTNACGVGDCGGIHGLTTTQFQSGLPTGFDPTIWAENPSINNGFPYLINNPPPQ
jgi:GLUG motif-containing protein